jgi:HSP20 family protein
MAKQEVKINEQQDQQSQQQSQRTQQATAGAGSQQGGTQQSSTRGMTPGFLASRAVIPMSPFTLLNPFTMMRRMIEVMDPESGQQTASTQQTWTPPVEVYKTDGTFVVRAELPGLESENLRVEIADNAIVLEGEREFDEESGGLCSSERCYGRFYRAIPLPEGANVNQVEARLDNGLLEIRVPVEQQQNRQIPIQTGQASPQASAQASSQRRS